ncbi:TonB-dependent receptor plug domain-containing protein [Caenimonas koreensis]|uniref:TonB-dependent receptor plug domain-containing protein n=1 Tax=Caenimonas koreensis TaxID=367474 RepID=UPI003784477F
MQIAPARSMAGIAGITLAAWTACVPALAQGQQSTSLVDLSLEQLANIEVTSVSKRAQRLADVAGSVYVITADDIRRSGATSLPEALRLAPNLHVARADANQYAISARGFNSVIANKMLVLVDGRTVYSPLFSGVFWEERDLMLEDIDRIEVLSGSGGTLYGSNAVNGVINVIKRQASDTQGALATALYGRDDRSAAARYGGTTGSGIAYRVYARRAERDNTVNASGQAVRDASGMNRAGVRAEHSGGGQQWTLQADAYDGRIDQGSVAAPSERRLSGGNVLVRWSMDHTDGGRTQVQAYADRTARDQPGSIRDAITTLDLDVQHLTRSFANHQLLVGGGYRWLRDNAENIAPQTLALLPPQRHLDLANIFAQDEIAVAESVNVTVGAKLERNAYTGVEFLPSARVTWAFAPNHLLWAAASRTVRAPARVDRDYYSPANPPYVIAGGADFVSEVARVFEAGYRAQPMAALSWSLTLFHHRFSQLRSVDATPGGLTVNNNFSGKLTGVEAWGSYRVSDSWKINLGTTQMREQFTALAGTSPVGGSAQLGNDPRSRWNFGSSWDLGGGHELDVTARRVGGLPNPAVPAYSAVDVRWGWHVRPGMQFSVTVRNINDPSHTEWGAGGARAELSRGAIAKLVWRQ